MRFTVIADYQERPAEGIQVVSKTIVDGLMAEGHIVRVVAPPTLARRLPALILGRPELVVFTHGPGTGGVLASIMIRLLTRARIMWVATRPDLHGTPKVLRGRRTAHVILCNRTTPELKSVARDAKFVQNFIGIDPARLDAGTKVGNPWADIPSGRPIAFHIGHLRRNRGLDLLIAAKRALRDRVEIVVVGSPTFEADPDVVEELAAAGVRVRRTYISNLAEHFESADVYLFPVGDEAGGAVDLPLGVLEAVACRCPVLAIEFGALRDALESVPGVTFTQPERFVEDLRAMLEEPHGLAERPSGLPDRLHARRTLDAVLEHAGGP